jgi:hypothetical protein
VPSVTPAVPARASMPPKPAPEPAVVLESGDYPYRYANINSQLMGGPVCDCFKSMIMGYAKQGNLPEKVRVKIIDQVTSSAEHNRCVR